MENKQAKELIDRYLSGDCSQQEKAIVETWFNEQAREKEGPEISDFQAMNKKIQLGLPTHSIIKPNKVKLWPKLAGAASIVLCLGIGVYYYQQSRDIKADSIITVANNVMPGGNKAFLTLANGKKISLTDAQNGELAVESGVKITKAADGKIIYTVADAVDTAIKNQVNTIETPRGGEYQVNLPDGTKVWLNAASSLKYPSSFASLKERRVELIGEAYFEVAKVYEKGAIDGKRLPFIVKTATQEVEVLGTHFNISSYADEPLVSTTLLEGSVRVLQFSTRDARLLKPNEQALNSGTTLHVKPIDALETIAWKNGKFVFVDESLPSVMRKIARWYDIEIIYEIKETDNSFNGSMSRFDDIRQVLRKIALTNKVHFRLEGRRLIVMK